MPDFSELEYKNERVKKFPKNKQIIKEFIDSFSLISDLTFSFILNLKEYKEVEKIRIHQFKIQEHLISNFINKFVYLHVGNYDKESKSYFRKIIKLFIQEIKGKGPLWKVKLFIAGVWLEVIEFEIFKNVRLRKINCSDFEFRELNKGKIPLVNIDDGKFYSTISIGYYPKKE